MALSANLTYAYLEDERSRFGEMGGSLALGYSVSSRVGAYAEVFGFAPEGDEREATSFLNGGFTFLLSPDYQLDLRGGMGLNDETPDYFVGIGASICR